MNFTWTFPCLKIPIEDFDRIKRTIIEKYGLIIHFKVGENNK